MSETPDRRRRIPTYIMMDEAERAHLDAIVAAEDSTIRDVMMRAIMQYQSRATVDARIDELECRIARLEGSGITAPTQCVHMETDMSRTYCFRCGETFAEPIR